MIDGKPYSTLKRHLATHGLTPAEYRTRYKLPADYPMTAPSYSEKRKALAVQIGLGRKRADAAATAPAPAQYAGEPKRRGRKPSAEPASASADAKPRGRKLSGTAALAKVRGGSAEG